MLTKGIAKKIELPHEPGEWLEIRKVSSGYIDVAREIASRRSARSIKDMGGIGSFDVGGIKRCPKCSSELVEGHECNPLDVFAKEERDKNPAAVDATSLDRKTMLNAGIHAWSYDEKVTEETIADLDEPTADWAFREIVSFLNETQTVGAKKEGTKTSTSS